MSEHLLEPDRLEALEPAECQRPPRRAQPDLILTELASQAVIDQLDDDAGPVELITFGSVREVCPKCQHTQLKLVLRQRRVRLAHLFCAECQGCFNAHYPGGACALSL